MMRKATFYILYISINLLMINPAFSANITLSNMLEDINNKQSTPELKQQAIRKGQERALLCGQCHGDDGNSKKPEVPNLAQQKPHYLLQQIEFFANGTRKNYVMNVLSRNFTQDDKVNLALFYANMKLKKINVDPKLVNLGQSLYQQKCSTCHGKDGAGKKDFARLAGQQPKYVENTLKRFRDKATGKENDDPSRRSSPIMEAIASPLTDENINALAAYIAHIK